ncbi:hypothetical protein [Beijerinckia sp. L45]|uniref:hypothetical protein n=1 Tax=Beijerinckia sp. L45 TaxID=1641855 RepID=UPI00131E6FE1|nr:hypothetical protein [Beijerinckia sp. L45]
MRISPILARAEISAVRKTAEVTRSSRTTDPDAAADADPRDAADERPRRRDAQLRAPTSAGNRSSNAVLSALIALQERR